MTHQAAPWLASLTIGLCATSAQAISLGQVDDFQDTTTQNWVSGNNNPNPPINVLDAGPAGVGDHVLQATANGGSGAGGKLVFFNSVQWTGDYNAAGVNKIRFQANNVGTNPVSLGFTINGSGTITQDTGTIAPGSGWQTYEIPLDTLVLGSPTTLDSVTELRMRYIQGGSFVGGSPVQVHLNNIEAVPEPTSLALLGLGGLLMSKRRR